MSSNPEPVDFRSSVELILSNDPDGLFNAANDLTQISKSEAIEVLYLLAIEHGVKEAYLNYGWFLRDINRPREALVEFQKALEAGDPQAAYYLVKHPWRWEDILTPLDGCALPEIILSCRSAWRGRTEPWVMSYQPCWHRWKAPWPGQLPKYGRESNPDRRSRRRAAQLRRSRRRDVRGSQSTSRNPHPRRIQTNRDTHRITVETCCGRFGCHG